VAFGTITVGRVELREALTSAQEQSGGVSLSGQEAASATPGVFPLSREQLGALQADIRGLAGDFVPVRFTDKSSLDGYYVVGDTSAEMMDWQGEVVTCDWSINLARVGSDSEVDVEARLAGPLTRVNDFSATGERWHAPPIGHTAYWAGSATPSTMTRQTSEGPITVYRGVPVLTSPRYACPVGDYLAGRVRISDAGRERTGTMWPVSPGGWELTNGLVRVIVSADTLSIGAWTGGAWANKGWALSVNGTTLGGPDSATVVRNDVECVIVRLLWSLTVGRVTCDLTLRRGSRFLELYARTSTAATIKVARTEAEAGVATTPGYVRATAADAAGHRYIVGAARTFVPDVNGGISKASATSMDAFVGVEFGGASAVSGDTAADVFKAYLGSAAEVTRGARR
jgi:hypothetical protein